MQDQYSSVESMLRWQIEDLRKRATELRDALNKRDELYALPKQNDGLPDEWAWGKLTHQQVMLAHALDSLKWVSHEIEKAETALLDGNFPTSIHWIVSAIRSLGMTASQWEAGGAIRMYRYIGKIRKGHSISASCERKEKPSKEDLLADRENYYAANGHYHGWLKAASRKYGLSGVTINKICDT